MISLQAFQCLPVIITYRHDITRIRENVFDLQIAFNFQLIQINHVQMGMLNVRMDCSALEMSSCASILVVLLCVLIDRMWTQICVKVYFTWLKFSLGSFLCAFFRYLTKRKRGILLFFCKKKHIFQIKYSLFLSQWSISRQKTRKSLLLF